MVKVPATAPSPRPVRVTSAPKIRAPRLGHFEAQSVLVVVSGMNGSMPDPRTLVGAALVSRRMAKSADDMATGSMRE
jgi:hypothetical protein